MVNTVSTNHNGQDLASLVARNEKEILNEWIMEMAGATRRIDLIKESEIQVSALNFCVL